MTRSMDLTTGHVVLKTASLHTPVFEYNNYCCCKVFGPVWQLLLIGAGQISHYVALMAQALGYGVLVCDPRDNYSANWDVPGTMQVAMMPDDIVRERIKDER